jgi:glycosyltransferase involved in cell wall biosynthesis
MFTISYIVVTKNRLPFLKVLLDKVLPQLTSGEEMIVIDGGSTDGSAEYLAQLHGAGKIHQFVSEPDRNQAHGWNKGFLMAKGTIIKKMIDDDVHDIDSIRKCRDFMLAHPEIDICISNSMESRLGDPGKAGIESRLPYYQQWKAGQTKTFTFGDVTMLVRRSSLSFIGLYDTQFKMIDWEYSLRCSYLNARIAYYTGYNSLSVTTPGNISSTATNELMKLEAAIGKAKYGYPGDGSDINTYSRIKIAIGKTYQQLSGKNPKQDNITALPAETKLREHYSHYYTQLEEQNRAGEWEFIH